MRENTSPYDVTETCIYIISVENESKNAFDTEERKIALKLTLLDSTEQTGFLCYVVRFTALNDVDVPQG